MAAVDDRTPAPGLAAAPSWEACCERALAVGRRAHPTLALDPAAFARSLTARVDDRLAAAGLSPGEPSRRAWLERAALADVTLALACEQGCPGAWETLVAEHAPRLAGLARSRGADAAEAERLSADVLGDLALPASASDPRALLATYAGGGSLFGFLAVLLTRKQARRARDPRERGREPLAESNASPRAGPAATADLREQATCFERALADGVARLTPKEALALALKHRDGVSQREIAGVLGVGAPRVSRLLAAAVERLRRALRERCPDLAAEGDAVGGALRDVLTTHLARLDVPREGR